MLHSVHCLLFSVYAQEAQIKPILPDLKQIGSTAYLSCSVFGHYYRVSSWMLPGCCGVNVTRLATSNKVRTWMLSGCCLNVTRQGCLNVARHGTDTKVRTWMLSGCSLNENNISNYNSSDRLRCITGTHVHADLKSSLI